MGEVFLPILALAETTLNKKFSPWCIAHLGNLLATAMRKVLIHPLPPLISSNNSHSFSQSFTLRTMIVNLVYSPSKLPSASSPQKSEDDGTASVSTSSNASTNSSPTTTPRSVRFGLEHNQVHEAPIQLPHWTKHVTFCLEDNEFIDPPLYHDDDESTWYAPHQIAEWKEESSIHNSTAATTTLTDIYRQCVASCPTEKQVRRIRQRPGVDRAVVRELYQNDNDNDDDTILGREQVPPSVRGGTVAALMQFILLQGSFMMATRHGSTNTSQCRTSVDPLAHVSLCVSRPARVYAQETALALHHALASEEDVQN